MIFWFQKGRLQPRVCERLPRIGDVFPDLDHGAANVFLVGRDRPQDDREDVEADGQGRQAVPTPKDEPKGEFTSKVNLPWVE